MILKLCCLLSVYLIIGSSASTCSYSNSYSTYTYWGYRSTGYRTAYKYCSAGCCSSSTTSPCCSTYSDYYGYYYGYTYGNTYSYTSIPAIGGSVAGVVIFLTIISVIIAACKKKTRVITTVAPAGNTISVATTQQHSQIGNQPYQPNLQRYPQSGSQYTGGYPYGNSSMASNPVHLSPSNLPGQPSYSEAQPLPPKYEPMRDSGSIPQ